jgi:transposase
MPNPSIRSRRDAQAMEQRRLAAIPRLEHGESFSSIARALGVSRQAVFVWAYQLRRRGEAGLRRRPRPGRPPKLTRAQLAQLPRLLAPGAEAHGFSSPIWTTQRVADLIRRRFGVRYDRDHVCRLLHRFGWSWQKPARRARERDEAAIQRWVNQIWPRVKKRAKAEGHAGFSRRERFLAAAHSLQDLGTAGLYSGSLALLQLAQALGNFGGHA